MNNEAILTTPWDQSVLPLRRGVKQGAVESPTFFGKVVEWVFGDAQVRCGWSRLPEAFPDLGLPGVYYMDDGVLWQVGVDQTEARLQDITKELAQCGLKVNHGKCAAYFSPHAKVRDLKVQGELVPGRSRWM